MSLKIILPSGTKQQVLEVSNLLTDKEVIYSIDTKELVVKSGNELVFLGKVVDWQDITNKPNIVDDVELLAALTLLKAELENYTDEEILKYDTHVRSNYVDKESLEYKLRTLTIDGGNLNG